MTALPSTARRARLLAAAIDGERGTVSAGASASALHEAGTDLVALAGQVQVLATEPPAPFLGALREQVMAAALEREAQLASAAGERAGAPSEPGTHDGLGALPPDAPRRTRHRGRRALATGLTSVLVTSGTAVGMTAVSAQALPGELLYPVKRGVEQVELALQRSAEARGLVLLEHAETRLAELQTLLGSEDAASDETQALAADVLEDFVEATGAASEALEAADGSVTGSSGDGLEESTDARLESFLDASADSLGGLADDLSTEVTTAYFQAATAVNDLQDKAVDLCGDCALEAPGDLVDPSPTGQVSGSPAPPITSVADGSGSLPLPDSGTEVGDPTSSDPGDRPGGGADADSPPDAGPPEPPEQEPEVPGDAPPVADEEPAPDPGQQPGIDDGAATGSDGGTGTDDSADDPGTNPDSGGDGGTGTDTDTGGEPAPDAGTGTDTGTDTGGEPAPDAGTGTDTDTGSGTDTGGEPAPDAGTGTDTDTGSGTGSGTDTDTGTDTGGEPAPDAGTGTDTDSSSDGDGATDGDSSTDADGKPAPDTGTGTDSGGTAEPEAEPVDDSSGAGAPAVVKDETDGQAPVPAEEQPVATAP